MKGFFGRTKTDVNNEKTDQRLRDQALRRSLRAQVTLMILCQLLCAYLYLALPRARDGAWLVMLMLLAPLCLLAALSLPAGRLRKRPGAGWTHAALLLPCLTLDVALALTLLCDLMKGAALCKAPTWLIAAVGALVVAGCAFLGAKSGVSRACDLLRFIVPVLIVGLCWLSGAKLDAGSLYPLLQAKQLMPAVLLGAGGVWTLALILPPQGEEKTGWALLGGALAVLCAAAVALHGSLSVRWDVSVTEMSRLEGLLMPVQGASPILEDGFLAAVTLLLLLGASSACQLARQAAPKGGAVFATMGLALGVAAALCPPLLSVLLTVSPLRWVLAVGSLFLGRKPS